MPLALSPVPEISISLASPEEPAPEPFSPFSECTFLSDDSESFRPSLLSPPPSSMTPKQLSPLRPKDAPVTGKGLERERFEAMLQAQRERNAALGSKRSSDLRKEIALKVHKSKQMERRALFLSKVQAPPSPSATFIPVTPPESPAVFHYSLPSPGLESPLEVFEALTLGRSNVSACQPWVEQVDFRLPGDVHPKAPLRSTPATATKRKVLPSLDQITARMSSIGHVAAPAHEEHARASMRLPSFLRTPARVEQPAVQSTKAETLQPAARARAKLPTGVGRLRFPTREAAEAPKVEIAQPTPCLPPVSPRSPLAPRLQVTTTVVPRTASSSPVELTESNLMKFSADSRERTAHNMLTRLRRRTLPPQIAVPAPGAIDMEDETERKSRRHSAPPELPQRNRIGFSHPILELPGAF
ncbi:hypothetical protein DICSQDRAFT_130813 [Dichomitus squalens LYAD-421 SS1]|uniref:Uncharacterized protein n=1 Tax=Dichomitus squalens TaxID=114155 RepID=A0A4Q9N501_9APHY|nr:uncharacterized protein DICSQDRAFT_130813 [Dichomitus squalens LYAD-421 SS1]EJF66555.1 hypothetical protein DICSQDRAFT_130813 [Dichomitus squalens LYAD-421 SS1]TBU35087.1 hypothetical protein BD311DRAFT_202893 [Dichomitus squalens]